MALQLAAVSGELFYQNENGEIVQVQSGDSIPDNAQLYAQNGAANIVTTDGKVASIPPDSSTILASTLPEESATEGGEFIVYDDSLATLGQQLENADLLPSIDTFTQDPVPLSERSSDVFVETSIDLQQTDNTVQNTGSSFVQIIRVVENIGAPEFAYETTSPVRPTTDFASNAIEAGSGTITLQPLGESNTATPIISGESDLSNGTPITITITDDQGNEAITVISVQEDGSFSTQIDPLEDGRFNLVVSAPAPNGDVVEVSDTLIIDTTFPTILVNELGATDSAFPEISGETDLTAGSEVTIVITDAGGNAQTIIIPVADDGSFSASPLSEMVEGDYTITVSATDTAGNTTTITATGTIDLTLPTLTVDNVTTTDESTQIISGNTDLPSGDIVTISLTDALGNNQTITTQVQDNGTFSTAIPSNLAQGDFIADISVTDDAGNINVISQTGTVTNEASITLTNVGDPTNNTPTISGDTNLTTGETVSISVTD
ncbi:Ig-like domain-containing protein, partial [Alteromonas sp. C1M14]|uniref:Ig-like domain-containing protein n=1 Tax=Alteromonas sp. C1M14 TaxID=2841567 RepID=UPI001C07F2DA|nr:Ig-like domain repeat protein [Alteromonas sp. C1M14]